MHRTKRAADLSALSWGEITHMSLEMIFSHLSELIFFITITFHRMHPQIFFRTKNLQGMIEGREMHWTKRATDLSALSWGEITHMSLEMIFSHLSEQLIFL